MALSIVGMAAISSAIRFALPRRNGLGAGFVVSPASVNGLSSNNVGEPANHPSSRFVNQLPMFAGKTIWEGEPFFSVGPNLQKADGTGNPVLPAATNSCSNGCSHSPCSVGAALSPDCFADATTICAFDPFCCANSWDGQCVGEVASGCL